MTIGTSQEKFTHDLGDIYNAEHQILSALQQMESQASDQKLKSALHDHINETQHQIKNLDQVWSDLGMQPQPVDCDGAEGIISDGKKHLQAAQNDAIRDTMIDDAADMTEHYEMSSYQSLCLSAKLMGKDKIVDLLEQNLQQEQEMARRLEQCAPELDKRAMQSQRMTAG